MKKQGVLIFIMTLILLVRIAYYFTQPDLSTDHISHMAMAQNFMEGHGFSFKYLDAQKEIYYNTHIQWPPLYPLILALISFITRNTLLSSFIIQTSVIFSLVIIWKKIFNLFKPFISAEAYLYFISLLIISTSILNNINTILVLAILILSLSLYFTFAYLLLDKSKKLNLILSTLFASLLFWTHYSYFLVAFYPAVVLFIIFYSGKDRTYFIGSLSSFFTSLIVTSGVLIYNYITAGFVNYMANRDSWDVGFFPERLCLTDPFVIKAFFNTGYLPTNLFFFNKNYHGLLTLLLQIASFVILIIVIVLFLRLKKNKNIPFEKTSHLFIPFFVIIVLTISFLLYFTLRYHEIPNPNWTHIGDARYLSAIYLSIIAIVIVLVFNKAGYINKKIVNFIKAVLICSFFISLSINIYIIVEHWGKYSFRADNNKAEEDYEKLFDNIKFELSKENLPVFINNDLTVLSSRMSQYAKAAVINVSEVKEIEQFPSNMVFFFILPGEKYYRDEDNQLLDWGKKFNLNNIGKIDTKFTLFKVNNQKY